MIPHQSERAFGLTFTAIFSLITLIGWLAFDSRLYWLVAVAAFFLISALLFPWVLMPLNRLWYVFSQRLGKVANFLILGVFYFSVILPYSFIFRLLGRDPMKRSFEPKVKSYMTKVGRQVNSETFRDMF